MDSKKEAKAEVGIPISEKKPEKKKEQPKPTRGRVIKNINFTRRVDREAKKNG